MRDGEVADLREPAEPSIPAAKDHCHKAEAALEPYCRIVAVPADRNFHRWVRLRILAWREITVNDGPKQAGARLQKKANNAK